MDGAFATSRARGIGLRLACTFFIVATVMTVGLAAPPAHAQSWISVGPPGGDVRALVADPRDPQRLYLGTSDGILYRSEDGGLHWRRLAPGFPLRGCSLDEIAVTDGGVVFVGYWEVYGHGGGVARSEDNGQTFVILKGIEGESVRALALAPSKQEVMAAGALQGVFLSRDGGQRWKRITSKRDHNLRNLESLAFDPSDPRVLYAGTWHLAWKTADGGGTWTPAHRGMIDDSDVMTLTVDRRDRRTLYATACTGIYRSTDEGGQWAKLSGIPESSRRTRAFSTGDAGLLVAGTTEGLWISEDGGSAWRLATPRKLVINALLVQPDGTILLGTEGAGVLRSADRGRTWAASNTGFSERFVSALLFDPARRRLLAAVAGNSRHSGVFVAPGVRGPWARLGEGLDGRQVLSLALLGNTILAGTDDGIFARRAKATSWTRLATTIAGGEVHPRVTELLARAPDRLLAGTSVGLLRSSDGGRTWTRPMGAADEINGLAASPVHPEWLVTATTAGIFRSKDGGAIWRPVAPALPKVTVHALAFMPADDRVVLATTTGGLFRSHDRGNTWQLATGGIPHSNLTGIAFHGRTIYVGDFTWGGIFRSPDGGMTWQRMPSDGLASDRVATMGLDPRAPGQLLVAPPAGGLYYWREKPSQGEVASQSRRTKD